jgi:hypothetical protein
MHSVEPVGSSECCPRPLSFLIDVHAFSPRIIARFNWCVVAQRLDHKLGINAAQIGARIYWALGFPPELALGPCSPRSALQC